MATLDLWRTFLITPQEVAFPHLELIGRDGEPPILAGSGAVRMPSLDRFEFTLNGFPDDVGYAFAEIQREQQNRYDGLERFRLRGVDTSGTEWSLGWVTLQQVDPGNDAWTLAGEVSGLAPYPKSDMVSSESCTELVFLLPVNHPISLNVDRFVLTEQPGSRPRREHVLETLGSTVRFSYEPSSGALSVTAMHSAELPPTYTENWLGEPLRILFGQLIFPRLVARNLGDGRAHIDVRRCPALIGGVAHLAALRQNDHFGEGKEDFWRCYTGLLTVIARAGYFDAHKITHLYEEVIQARRGTRWTWAMTFASCIEGLANMLEPSGRDRPDADEVAVAGLVKHINAWRGDVRLKQNAINAVQRALKTTTIIGLRQLVAVGAITAIQLKAWEEIRHSVMHGSLISPYSSEEEDNKLLALAEMMHALTREILQRSSESRSGKELNRWNRFDMWWEPAEGGTTCGRTSIAARRTAKGVAIRAI